MSEAPPGAEKSPPVSTDAPGGEAGVLSRAFDAALYGLSLPERAARGMICSASGVLQETAGIALPEALRKTRLYELTVKKMLRFLVDDVGRMRELRSSPDGAVAGAAAEAAGEADPDFLYKKAIGNVVDVAGLTVLHVSPLWVLAIFSDVALGTRTYLRALAAELEKQGVIEKSARIDDIDGLLASLERASGMLAETVDTPPLTVAELKKSVEKLREEAARIDLTKVVSAEDVAAVWKEIEATARLEGRSLLEVSGAIAMMSFSQLVRAGKGAYGSVKVGFDLVQDNFIEHYFQAIRRIHEKGYYETVLETYEPYVRGLAYLFEPTTESTTERLLKGKLFREAWRKIRSWCCSKPARGGESRAVKEET
jgi:hypothetical protein